MGDVQGDTPLHAAALNGHVQSCILLQTCIRLIPNKNSITPLMLAKRFLQKNPQDLGAQRLVTCMTRIEDRLKQGESIHTIYGCPLDTWFATVLYYGSRWYKSYDYANSSYYYSDRVGSLDGSWSSWVMPDTYDEAPRKEQEFEIACHLLHQFYSKYNPAKLKDMGLILDTYRGKFSDLFLQLANRYAVTDLSMFEGIEFD